MSQRFCDHCLARTAERPQFNSFRKARFVVVGEPDVFLCLRHWKLLQPPPAAERIEAYYRTLAAGRKVAERLARPPVWAGVDLGFDASTWCASGLALDRFATMYGVRRRGPAETDGELRARLTSSVKRVRPEFKVKC